MAVDTVQTPSRHQRALRMVDVIEYPRYENYVMLLAHDTTSLVQAHAVGQ
jgi:hypothetical protein